MKFYVGWNCLSPLYAAPSRNFIRPTNRSQTNCGLEWIPFNKYKQRGIQIKTGTNTKINASKDTKWTPTNCCLEWIPFNKYKEDDIQIKT